MTIPGKLDAARELLARAQRVPEGEALWLVTLAWSQLQEVATALETAHDRSTITRDHRPPLGTDRDEVLGVAHR